MRFGKYQYKKFLRDYNSQRDDAMIISNYRLLRTF